MVNTTSETVGYQTRSLIRALAILDSFGPASSTLSVKDLHELLGVPKPTISRLASVLEQHGLLRGEGHAYQLGPKTFELGALFAQQFGVQQAGQPPLEAMAREASQTSSLAMLAGRDVVYLVVARPTRPIHHVTAVGSREFAHVTGLGKALLAALPPATVDRMFGDDEPLARLTPNTICDRQALYEELERTRERGYALDEEEFAAGLRCVAINVQLPRLGSAAISVSGPAADYGPEQIADFVKLLHRTEEALAIAFGEAADYSLPVPGRSRASLPVDGVDDGDPWFQHETVAT
jgi:DNA-binding IclR family transcriptional regulator